MLPFLWRRVCGSRCVVSFIDLLDMQGYQVLGKGIDRKGRKWRRGIPGKGKHPSSHVSAVCVSPFSPNSFPSSCVSSSTNIPLSMSPDCVRQTDPSSSPSPEPDWKPMFSHTHTHLFRRTRSSGDYSVRSVCVYAWVRNEGTNTHTNTERHTHVIRDFLYFRWHLLLLPLILLPISDKRGGGK